MKRSAMLLILIAGCVPVESTELIHTTGEVPARRVVVQKAISGQQPSEKSVPVRVAPRPEPPPDSPYIPPPKRFSALLVSPQKEELYRRFVRDGSTAFLRDEDLIWYDDEVMPKVFQVSDEGTAAVKLLRTERNVSANNEFPWNEPGGVRGGAHREVRFVRPPAEGPMLEWWRLRENGVGRSRGIDWRFLPGTMFGEIITIPGPDGFQHTSVVRTRTRRANGTWRVNQFQPIRSLEEMLAALDRRGIGISSWGTIQSETLDSAHPKNRFFAIANVELVPRMHPTTVADILDREPFRSVSETQWRPEQDIAAPSVTPSQGFSLFPPGWAGSFIPVNSTSCMRCHEDAGRLVAIPEEGERRWRIRGNGGIFSWHVWDPATIDSQRVQFNQRLVQAGLIRHREGFP